MAAISVSELEHATAAHADAETQLRGLRTLRDLLIERIDRSATAARSGKSMDVDVTDLSHLADRKADLDHEIMAAERSLQIAKHDLETATRDARRSELDAVLECLRTKKEQFSEKYLELCLFLSSIAQLSQRAMELTNASIPMHETLPRKHIESLTSCPDPLDSLLAQYAGDTGFAFRWAVRVVPLQERFHKSQQEAKACETNNSK
jgi:hypothetical protein